MLCDKMFFKDGNRFIKYFGPLVRSSNHKKDLVDLLSSGNHNFADVPLRFSTDIHDPVWHLHGSDILLKLVVKS